VTTIPVFTEATKHCPGSTGQEAHVEPTTLFASDKSRTDGLAPYCRKCAATKQREWKQRNPEKVRAAKTKYRTRLAPSPA
jgi:hypothetical protein